MNTLRGSAPAGYHCVHGEAQKGGTLNYDEYVLSVSLRVSLFLSLCRSVFVSVSLLVSLFLSLCRSVPLFLCVSLSLFLCVSLSLFHTLPLGGAGMSCSRRLRCCRF